MVKTPDDRPPPAGFDPEEFFERAAILEFDGMYNRYTAYNLAWNELHHIREKAKAEKKKQSDLYLSNLLLEYSKTGGFI
ncbi:MAG: hypothetical protein IPM69_11835 [Ignavibacteria bacterium]|nr:hypothetical protein [Ignavibacteria bacterium]